MTDSPTNPRCFALIPCAGTGSRAGAPVPKQYQTVAGSPMVLHTLAAFASVPRLAGVVVAVAPGDDFFAAHSLPAEVADCGGATRAATVANGLNYLLDTGALPADWVLVHDAARCLVTPDMIERLIDACAGDRVGGLLALPLPDTLKSALGDRVQSTLPRSGMWLAQTPQMFRIGPLRDALAAAGAGVTDESSAMEHAGHQPLLVPGSARNFKVTYPEDFALAAAVLESRSQHGS